MANPSYEEIDLALRRAWFPVARSVDIDQPQSSTLLGESLVVYRTSSGGAAVASRRCPHRGGDLSIGQVVGDEIECPYHGWRFGVSGACTAIPALGESAAIPSNAKVTAFPAVEKYGLVWTCLGDPAVEVPDLPELDEHNMTFLAAEPVQTQAGALAALENFRDVAHFPFVHKKSMGNVAKEIERLEVRSEGLETWLTRRYSATGGGEDVYRDKSDIVFTYHAVMPALVSAFLNEGPDGYRVVLECFAPMSSSGGCRIFLVSGVAEDYTGATADEALAAEVGVLAEDKPILDSVMPPEIPLQGEAVEVSIAADRYTLTTRQAYLKFVKHAMEDAGIHNAENAVS